MNTPNNKRKKASCEKIQKVFVELIQTKNINEISVTEIVEKASINRSTFYANYMDIYDLADKVKEKMYYDYLEFFPEESASKKHSYDYLKLFNAIKDNQIFFKTAFYLDFDFTKYYDYNMDKNEQALKYFKSTQNIDYHIEFFKAGMAAIIKKWLFNGCRESPMKMQEILEREYMGRQGISSLLS